MPTLVVNSEVDGEKGVLQKEKLKWHQKFARQKFEGWRPILNVASAQIFFISVGIFCISLGIPILTASLTVRRYEIRYEGEGPFKDLDDTARQELLWRNSDAGVPVTVQFRTNSHMNPPIYLFYRMADFYQNYRRYVRSYDATSMHNNGSGVGAAACEPFRFQNFEQNQSLPDDGAITPCGQIAHSNFNDTYQISITPEGGSETPLDLDDSNIAWASDRNHLYGPVTPINYNVDPDFRGGNTTNNLLDESEHWMVWMKPAGPREVNKLYARINQPIPAGSTVTVTVANRYNTYGFGSSKSVILTTNSWVGGKNNTLGIVYIVVGGLSFSVALAFFLAYNAGLVRKRKYADLSELSWLKKHDGAVSRPHQSGTQQHVQRTGTSARH